MGDALKQMKDVGIEELKGVAAPMAGMTLLTGGAGMVKTGHQHLRAEGQWKQQNAELVQAAKNGETIRNEATGETFTAKPGAKPGQIPGMFRGWVRKQGGAELVVDRPVTEFGVKDEAGNARSWSEFEGVDYVDEDGNPVDPETYEWKEAEEAAPPETPEALPPLKLKPSSEVDPEAIRRDMAWGWGQEKTTPPETQENASELTSDAEVGEVSTRPEDSVQREENQAQEGAETARPETSFDTELETVTAKFDADVDKHVAGTPPNGGVYHLGNPGEILKSAGLDDLPITLGAGRLSNKASAEYKNKHPFDLSDVKGLPKAINHPVAVFDNVTDGKSKVVLTELQDKNGHNFVVALEVRTRAKATTNEILTVFPKDRPGSILEWIVSKNNALRYVDKEKALNFISSQATNPLVGGDNAQGINPKHI